jgi:branched-chain amino acid transport system substrate-binding protein
VQALQVILAAIEKSDGTRKGVTAAVLAGDGIAIPAATAMLGKDLKIDPKSGDINLRDISVEQVKDTKEEFLKPWPVS